MDVQLRGVLLRLLSLPEGEEVEEGVLTRCELGDCGC